MQVPEYKRRTAPSPLILMKAEKNAVEVEGMKNAHLRDAVALCDFLSLLQEEVGYNHLKKIQLKLKLSLFVFN